MWTAFTDNGHMTWMNAPNGLVHGLDAESDQIATQPADEINIVAHAVVRAFAPREPLRTL
ncbi:MAG: hypothetical protein ACRDGF_05425 [Chloroflexota bacterium]